MAFFPYIHITVKPSDTHKISEFLGTPDELNSLHNCKLVSYLDQTLDLPNCPVDPEDVFHSAFIPLDVDKAVFELSYDLNGDIAYFRGAKSGRDLGFFEIKNNDPVVTLDWSGRAKTEHDLIKAYNARDLYLIVKSELREPTTSGAPTVKRR